MKITLGLFFIVSLFCGLALLLSSGPVTEIIGAVLFVAAMVLMVGLAIILRLEKLEEALAIASFEAKQERPSEPPPLGG